jgi:cytoskeletal protein RodZ
MDSAPSPAPTRADPANFRVRADAYHTWLVPWVNTQFPAVLEWIRARANEVYAWSVNAQAASVNVTALVNSSAVQNAAANAATAQAAATAAAQYASQAQATNPDSPIRINPTRVMANFTLPTGYNGASAGPISIDDGVTVTISNGATWSIH